MTLQDCNYIPKEKQDEFIPLGLVKGNTGTLSVSVYLLRDGDHLGTPRLLITLCGKEAEVLGAAANHELYDNAPALSPAEVCVSSHVMSSDMKQTKWDWGNVERFGVSLDDVQKLVIKKLEEHNNLGNGFALFLRGELTSRGVDLQDLRDGRNDPKKPDKEL